MLRKTFRYEYKGKPILYTESIMLVVVGLSLAVILEKRNFLLTKMTLQAM